MTLPLTPSQTVGPFFALGLSATIEHRVVPEGTSGAVRVSGQVLDGRGEPVPDAVVETWQPEGAARCATDDEGHFVIVTVKPAHPTADAAPHLDVSVFARGLLSRLVTRTVLSGRTCGQRDRSGPHGADGSRAGDAGRRCGRHRPAFRHPPAGPE